MLLHLLHETRYAYTPTVESAHHVLHLKPASHAGQQLLRHSLSISPQPARLQELTDVYGNTRSYFSLQGPHDKLTVRATDCCRPRPTSKTRMAQTQGGVCWRMVTTMVAVSGCDGPTVLGSSPQRDRHATKCRNPGAKCSLTARLCAGFTGGHAAAGAQRSEFPRIDA